MIITITREFGSGGRTIAKKLAEKLGYAYYDYEIVQQIAQESGFAKEYIEENGEDASSTSTFGFIWNNYGYNLSDELYIAQRNVICELADKGNCVIVGRCSDYILQDKKNNINVYIYSNYETRLRNCIDILHMKREEAKTMINKVDKARISYHKNFAKFLPDDPEHKDVMIDSGLLGVEGTARILAQIVTEKFGFVK